MPPFKMLLCSLLLTVPNKESSVTFSTAIPGTDGTINPIAGIVALMVVTSPATYSGKDMLLNWGIDGIDNDGGPGIEGEPTPG